MSKFNNIASKFLKVDPSTLRDEMTPADIPEWDSMNYLLFIAELEKEFNVSFTMDEVISAKSLGDVKNSLVAHGIIL